MLKKRGDLMVEVKILDFGYSLESRYHFMRFLIIGLDKKTEEQMLAVLDNIPLGNLKRFEVESNPNEGLLILERFSKQEYPFNKEVPSDEKIKSVEKMVKKFMGQN
jgi:hypothetical protein